MEMESVNENFQNALHELLRTELQSQQQQQNHLIDHVSYTSKSESPLLEPLELTQHCEFIGEPLKPMLPELAEEWLDKCKEYQKAGHKLENLKKKRNDSWHTYLTHDDVDFKRLLMDIYIDDYNQRLLKLYNKEYTKKQTDYEEQQQLTSSDGKGRCEITLLEIENSAAYHYEGLDERALSLLMHQYMRENNEEFIDTSADLIQTMNEYNPYFINMSDKYNFANQFQHQQQPKENKTNRRRRNYNRSRKYHNESPMHSQQQIQICQQNCAYPKHSQVDERKWIGYFETSPLDMESSSVYGALNDYYEQLLNLNVGYSYLQTNVDEQLFTYLCNKQNF